MATSKDPLILQLGEGYMNEFFRGTLFEKNGKVCMIRGCSSTHVSVDTVDPAHPEAAWSRESLPANVLSSFSDVAWPRLGYRNYKHTKMGNLVSYVVCQRSVLRGIRLEHLEDAILPICNCLDLIPFSGVGAGSDKYRAVQLFFPTWYTYKEGMTKIKENKFPAFALNEDMAIGLSLEPGNNRFCDIFFREKIVGSVDHSGEIMIANKVMKKRQLTKLYTMMEI